jgi:hypothetical protein
MLQISLSEAKATLDILQKQEAASLNLPNMRFGVRKTWMQSSVLGNTQVV